MEKEINEIEFINYNGNQKYIVKDNKIYFYSSKEYKLGRVNYESYRVAVGFKTWDGSDMKNFDELPIKIINAWIQGGIQANIIFQC